MTEPISTAPVRRILGLECLYTSRQPWTGDRYPDGLLVDPWDRGRNRYSFNGSCEGSMELQAAEALYDACREVAAACAAQGRPCYAAETGTCDGLSSAFIARAILDGASGHGRLWTCEYVVERSDGQPRPWPKLWIELGLDWLIEPKIGDSRRVETWITKAPALPLLLDVAFIDSEHTEDQVMAEWAVLGPRMRAGGVVLFHDVAIKEYAGVARAVGRIADELDVEVEMLNSSRGLAKIVMPVRVGEAAH